MLKKLKVLALTHKQAELTTIGKFYIEEALQAEKLSAFKAQFNLDELMYLATCNRVEIIMAAKQEITPQTLQEISAFFVPSSTETFIEELLPQLEFYEGASAVRHLFQVASSLDSMVIGEREIITQFRKAYEDCSKNLLTGDLIRVVVKHTIELAKKIFTDTELCTKPVSVVSLAYQALQDSIPNKNSRVLLIGAGQTNRNMGRFLKKGGYTNLTVFNRTLEKAEAMCAELGGTPMDLKTLPKYTAGFDIILTCTGSNHTIVDKEVYIQLLQGELTQKTVIDLAIPNDFDKSLCSIFPVKLIDIASLKPISEANIKLREKELVKCEVILDEAMVKFASSIRERKVELAMSQIPAMVKDIKAKAFDEVFAKELQGLDENSKAIIEKMMSYVEKKYISGPIKIAKEILLQEQVEA